MENLKKEIQEILSLFNYKNFLKAEIHTKKLIEKNPKNAFLYNILGLILTEQNKINEAVNCYNLGIKIQPDYAMFYNNLGNIFKDREDYEKAKNYFEKSINLDNEIPEPHNNLGNLYTIINKHKDAINCFKKAIKIKNNFFFSYYNLGTTYKSLGEFDNAINVLKKCIILNPNFFPAHRTLSQMIKYKSEKNAHYIKLKEISENKKIKDFQKTEIMFAIGKALDDMTKFNEAFKFFTLGNNLRRKQINFSLDKEKNNFKEIKSTFNKKIINNYKDISNYDDRTIFIVGMPRSGTTLVEQILSAHPDVYGGDELNYLPDLIKKKFTVNNEINFSKNIDKNTKKFIDISNEYIEKIKKISKGTKKVTDKLPINFKWIGLIKFILPNSKIVHCIRDPRDTSLSIFKSYFSNKELNYAYNLKDICEYYNLYLDIMNHWKNSFPNFVIDIHYENLVTNSETEIRNLIKKCNLKWNKDCLKFYKNKRVIKTASDTQARKKIYKNSINVWKNYEKHFIDLF